MSYSVFKRFHDAMDAEMLRHLKLGDKGDWTQPTQEVSIRGSFCEIRKAVDTVAYLDEAFRAALEEYFENPTQDQMVDLANLLAMRYLHEEGLMGN